MARTWITRKELLAAAREEGLPIEQRGLFHPTTVIRSSLKKTATIIIIWEDGEITRGDVRADLAIKMTPTQAAQALGIL